MSPSQGFLLRWARWVRAHGRLVLAGWLVAVILASAAAHSAGTRYANNLSLGGTDTVGVFQDGWLGGRWE